MARQKSDQPRQATVSARSVEEAVEIGLKELGVSREQVSVDVEKDAKAGFLGIGGQEATVTLSETATSTFSLGDGADDPARTADLEAFAAAVRACVDRLDALFRAADSRERL